MNNYVIVKLSAEGFHFYPDAPEQVAFLSNRHRHVFDITCTYAVTNLNREVEIFICRSCITNYLASKHGTPCEFGAMSCEMIASEILQRFMDSGMVSCEVWEEGTGGGRAEL